jgi:hypothetical protein
MKHRGGKETNVVGTAFALGSQFITFACLPVSMFCVW